jgi:hypothetical protein
VSGFLYKLSSLRPDRSVKLLIIMRGMFFALIRKENKERREVTVRGTAALPAGLISACSLVGCAVALMCAFASAPAQADILYEFTQTSSIRAGSPSTMIFITMDFPTPDFSLSTNVTDTPIDLMGFSMSAPIFGNVDFSQRQNTSNFPEWNINITEIDGLLSGSIFFLDALDSSEFRLSISDNIASFHFVADDAGLCINNESIGCTFNGYFTEIPEPATLALFTTAVMALPLFRRRTRFPAIHRAQC